MISRKFTIFVLSLMISIAASAAPPAASAYIGSVSVNEVSFRNTTFVELYFSQPVTTNNWQVVTASNNGRQGNCQITDDSYQAGEVLVLEGACLNLTGTAMEIAVLDGNGLFVHFTSLWFERFQSFYGIYGNPFWWPASHWQATGNHNGLTANSASYCAAQDGQLSNWSDTCGDTKGQSNQSTCDATFAGVASAVNGITFLQDSQVDNAGLNTLIAQSVSNSSSQLTCTLAQCLATGSSATGLTLPAFLEVGNGFTAQFTSNGTLATRQYNFVQIAQSATVTTASNGQPWRIRTLQLGAQTTLILTAGDYYIQDISIGAQAQIQTAGDGLVRLFVQNSFEVGDEALINSPALNTPGDPSQILIATYNNYYQSRGSTVTANVIALNHAYMGSPQFAGGNVSAPTNHYGRVSAYDITYSNAMRSTLTGTVQSGGLCSETPVSSVTQLAHWTFDEGVSSFGNEVTGGANVNIISGGERTNQGKVCGALNSDGTASAQVASTSFSPDMTVGSVALWLRPTELSEAPMFFGYGSNRFYGIMTTNNTNDNHNNEGVIQFGIPRIGNDSPVPILASHGLSNQAMLAWHHIAFSWNTNTNTYNIWLNGNALTVTAPSYGFTPRTNVELAFGAGPDNFLLDEVHFFDGEIDQAMITDLINAQRDCPFDIDEFRISHSGAGLTCQGESITIGAYKNGQLKTNYNGGLNLSIDSGLGRWFQGDGTALSDANDGLASYQYTGAEGGTISLLLQQTAAGRYNINASNGLATELSFDPPIDYSDTGLQWLDSLGVAIQSASNNHFYTAGDSVNLSIRAVRTDQATLACEAIFPANSSVTARISSQCVNPGSCLTQLEVGQNQLIPIANLQQLDGGSAETEQTWQLDRDSEADLAVRNNDIGLIQLNASMPILDPAGNPLSEQLTGSTQLVFQPATLDIVAIENSLGQPVTGLMTAGEPYQISLAALTSTGQRAANFGNEQPAIAPTLATELRAPVGGQLGTLTIVDNWAVAPDSELVATIRYAEVGEISLTPNLSGGYLATPFNNTSSSNLNRFVPAYLTATVENFALTSECSGFNYLGQPIGVDDTKVQIRAFNAQDRLTENYNAITALATPSSPPAWQPPAQSVVNGNWAAVPSLAGVDWTLSQAQVMWPRQQVVPFREALSLTLDTSILTDSDGVCLRADATAPCESLSASTADIEHLYGRWLLSPASGSQAANQFVSAPYRLQIWDQINASKQGFVTQLANSCPSAPSTSYKVGGLCEGFSAGICQSLAVANQASALESGSGAYQFVGNGQAGSIEVRMDAPTWLQYDFDGNGVEEGSSALIRFGIWTGQSPILYRLPAWR